MPDGPIRETFINVPEWAQVALYLGGLVSVAVLAWGLWRRIRPWQLGRQALRDMLLQDWLRINVPLGMVALVFALAKELSGEAHFERAQQTAKGCDGCRPDYGGSAAEKETSQCKTDQQHYVEVTEKRFNGVTRCC